MAVEVERTKIRDLAWQRTNELMSDESVAKHGLPKVVAIAAAPLVKADMAKPIIVNTGEQHTHITTIEVNGLNNNQLVDLLTGRQNGLANKSA